MTSDNSNPPSRRNSIGANDYPKVGSNREEVFVLISERVLPLCRAIRWRTTANALTNSIELTPLNLYRLAQVTVQLSHRVMIQPFPSNGTPLIRKLLNQVSRGSTLINLSRSASI